MSGSWRWRTSENAVRTRGDASVSVGRYIGSEATTTAIAASASAPRPSASRQSERVLLDRPEIDRVGALLLPDAIEHRQRFVVARRRIEVAGHRQRTLLCESRCGETGRKGNGQARGRAAQLGIDVSCVPWPLPCHPKSNAPPRVPDWHGLRFRIHQHHRQRRHHHDRQSRQERQHCSPFN